MNQYAGRFSRYAYHGINKYSAWANRHRWDFTLVDHSPSGYMRVDEDEDYYG